MSVHRLGLGWECTHWKTELENTLLSNILSLLWHGGRRKKRRYFMEACSLATGQIALEKVESRATCPSIFHTCGRLTMHACAHLKFFMITHSHCIVRFSLASVACCLWQLNFNKPGRSLIQWCSAGLERYQVHLRNDPLVKGSPHEAERGKWGSVDLFPLGAEIQEEVSSIKKVLIPFIFLLWVRS